MLTTTLGPPPARCEKKSLTATAGRVANISDLVDVIRSLRSTCQIDMICPWFSSLVQSLLFVAITSSIKVTAVCLFILAVYQGSGRLGLVNVIYVIYRYQIEVICPWSHSLMQLLVFVFVALTSFKKSKTNSSNCLPSQVSSYCCLPLRQ